MIPNNPEDRDGFGFFFPMRVRAIPIVEKPSRWPEFMMTALYLSAGALAVFAAFNS